MSKSTFCAALGLLAVFHCVASQAHAQDAQGASPPPSVTSVPSGYIAPKSEKGRDIEDVDVPIARPYIEGGTCSLEHKAGEGWWPIRKACQHALIKVSTISAEVPGSFLVGGIYRKSSGGKEGKFIGVYGPAAGVGIAVRLPWIKPEVEYNGILKSDTDGKNYRYYSTPTGINFALDFLISFDVKITSLHRMGPKSSTDTDSKVAGLFGFYFGFAPGLVQYDGAEESKVSLNLGVLTGFATDSVVGSGFLLAFQPGITGKF